MSNDWEKLFLMKQDDWLDACREVDQLNAELSRLREENAGLRDVLEGFYKASDLWLPRHAHVDQADEARALHALRSKLLAVLGKHPGVRAIADELDRRNGEGVMEILEPHDLNGWITAVIEGRWVQAKVYDEPSAFGINDGRVSKCAIGKTATHDPDKPFFEQMDFNYDRGLDFDNLPAGLLDKIIAKLEALPILEV